MRHYIPFARTGSSSEPSKTMDEYLGVDAFLALVRAQPPAVEFPLLIMYLIEFSGSVEVAYQRMTETWTDQSAQSYKAHYDALRKIKARVFELYAAASKKQDNGQEVDS